MTASRICLACSSIASQELTRINYADTHRGEYFPENSKDGCRDMDMEKEIRIGMEMGPQRDSARAMDCGL